MTALRLALLTTLAALALAGCTAPYGRTYSDSRDSYPGYYPGTAYPRIVPAPGPWINGIPTNPGSGGGF
jgi:hypothetical protein